MVKASPIGAQGRGAGAASVGGRAGGGRESLQEDERPVVSHRASPHVLAQAPEDGLHDVRDRLLPVLGEEGRKPLLSERLAALADRFGYPIGEDRDEVARLEKGQPLL